MQNSFTLRRVSLLALALLIALVAGTAFVAIASSATQTPPQSRLTDAAAAQNLEMVLQELERERLDQPNFIPPSTHSPSLPVFYEGAVHGQADPVME